MSAIELVLASALLVPAQAPDDALAGVGIDQKLDAQLPLDLEFRDESGAAVRLGAYFKDRPVALVLVYYRCPMLCTLVLNGLSRALRAMALDAGRDFELVAVSIDPRETPGQAAARREEYLRAYARPGAQRGYHFLTGEEAAIRALADAAGFRYRYDAARGEYAHAAGIVALTPAGRVSRYLLGVEYSSRDLRLALVEASAGRIGSTADRLLLLCFRYDPSRGRYSLAVLNLVRAGAVATAAGLGALVWALLRRERRPGPG